MSTGELTRERKGGREGERAGGRKEGRLPVVVCHWPWGTLVPSLVVAGLWLK